MPDRWVPQTGPKVGGAERPPRSSGVAAKTPTQRRHSIRGAFHHNSSALMCASTPSRTPDDVEESSAGKTVLQLQGRLVGRRAPPTRETSATLERSQARGDPSCSRLPGPGMSSVTECSTAPKSSDENGCSSPLSIRIRSEVGGFPAPAAEECVVATKQTDKPPLRHGTRRYSREPRSAVIRRPLNHDTAPSPHAHRASPLQSPLRVLASPSGERLAGEAPPGDLMALPSRPERRSRSGANIRRFTDGRAKEPGCVDAVAEGSKLPQISRRPPLPRPRSRAGREEVPRAYSPTSRSALALMPSGGTIRSRRGVGSVRDPHASDAGPCDAPPTGDSSPSRGWSATDPVVPARRTATSAVSVVRAEALLRQGGRDGGPGVLSRRSSRDASRHLVRASTFTHYLAAVSHPGGPSLSLQEPPTKAALARETSIVGKTVAYRHDHKLVEEYERLCNDLGEEPPPEVCRALLQLQLMRMGRAVAVDPHAAARTAGLQRSDTERYRLLRRSAVAVVAEDKARLLVVHHVRQRMQSKKVEVNDAVAKVIQLLDRCVALSRAHACLCTTESTALANVSEVGDGYIEAPPTLAPTQLPRHCVDRAALTGLIGVQLAVSRLLRELSTISHEFRRPLGTLAATAPLSVVTGDKLAQQEGVEKWQHGYVGVSKRAPRTIHDELAAQEEVVATRLMALFAFLQTKLKTLCKLVQRASGLPCHAAGSVMVVLPQLVAVWSSSTYALPLLCSLEAMRFAWASDASAGNTGESNRHSASGQSNQASPVHTPEHQQCRTVRSHWVFNDQELELAPQTCEDIEVNGVQGTPASPSSSEANYSTVTVGSNGLSPSVQGDGSSAYDGLGSPSLRHATAHAAPAGGKKAGCGSQTAAGGGVEAEGCWGRLGSEYPSGHRLAIEERRLRQARCIWDAIQVHHGSVSPSAPLQDQLPTAVGHIFTLEVSSASVSLSSPSWSSPSGTAVPQREANHCRRAVEKCLHFGDDDRALPEPATVQDLSETCTRAPGDEDTIPKAADVFIAAVEPEVNGVSTRSAVAPITAATPRCGTPPLAERATDVPQLPQRSRGEPVRLACHSTHPPNTERAVRLLQRWWRVRLRARRAAAAVPPVDRSPDGDPAGAADERVAPPVVQSCKEDARRATHTALKERFLQMKEQRRSLRRMDGDRWHSPRDDPEAPSPQTTRSVDTSESAAPCDVPADFMDVTYSSASAVAALPPLKLRERCVSNFDALRLKMDPQYETLGIRVLHRLLEAPRELVYVMYVLGQLDSGLDEADGGSPLRLDGVRKARGPQAATVPLMPLHGWNLSLSLRDRIFAEASHYSWRMLFSHSPHDEVKQRMHRNSLERHQRAQRVWQRNQMILACYNVTSEAQWLEEAALDPTFVSRIWNPKNFMHLLESGMEGGGANARTTTKSRHRGTHNNVDSEEPARCHGNETQHAAGEPEPPQPPANDDATCREVFRFVYDFIFQCFPTITRLEDLPTFLVSCGVYFLLQKSMSYDVSGCAALSQRLTRGAGALDDGDALGLGVMSCFGPKARLTTPSDSTANTTLLALAGVTVLDQSRAGEGLQPPLLAPGQTEQQHLVAEDLLPRVPVPLLEDCDGDSAASRVLRARWWNARLLAHLCSKPCRGCGGEPVAAHARDGQDLACDALPDSVTLGRVVLKPMELLWAPLRHSGAEASTGELPSDEFWDVAAPAQRSWLTLWFAPGAFVRLCEQVCRVLLGHTYSLQECEDFGVTE